MPEMNHGPHYKVLLYSNSYVRVFRLLICYFFLQSMRPSGAERVIEREDGETLGVFRSTLQQLCGVNAVLSPSR
jgi:hypothetical protein